MIDMQKKIVICDGCKKEFETIVHTSRQDDLEVQYLKCPKCGRVSIILVTDEKLRRMISLNQELLKKAQRARTKPMFDKKFWDYKNTRSKAEAYYKNSNLIDKVNKELL